MKYHSRFMRASVSHGTTTSWPAGAGGQFLGSEQITSQLPNGVVFVAASTTQKDVLGKNKPAANRATAEVIGKTIAERARAKKIDKVVFDRGGFQYQGKVKALADAAREGGLKF